MMYLNGQIKAVYLGGHYHSEAYLGSTLVWSISKKVPGEAHAQLAFANTAEGVAAVLLPGDAAEALAMTANVMAEAHGTADGSSGELLTLLTAAESTAAGTSNGAALENLLLQYTALGKGIIVNKRQIEELLKLTTSVPPAVVLGLVPVGDVGDELTMETTIQPAVALVLLPIETGDDLTLTTPVPPATEAVLKDSQAKLALQFMSNAPSVEPVDVVKCIADGEEQIQTTADGLPVFGEDGDAASEMEMRGSAQPEALEVAPQEAADNLGLRFAAEWTRGVGEKSSEDCEITAQAVGYAQIGGVVLIGIEGGQALQLTASVVGTAGEPVLEKTRAAMFVDGTLETVEAEDFGSLTALPDGAFRYCPYKSVYMADTVKTVGEGPCYEYKYDDFYLRCSPNINVVKTGWLVRLSTSTNNAVVDFTDYTFVPTLDSENQGSQTLMYSVAKVPSTLLNQWKAAPVWEKSASKIVAG